MLKPKKAKNCAACKNKKKYNFSNSTRQQTNKPNLKFKENVIQNANL